MFQIIAISLLFLRRLDAFVPSSNTFVHLVGPSRCSESVAAEHSIHLNLAKKSNSGSRNNVQNKGFQQYGDINPVYCSLSKESILNFIKERNKARRSRNFQKADEILATLNRNNVHLNDSKKLWRADGGLFDIRGYSQMEYTKSSSSKPISQREEEYVVQRLRERSKAKMRRDFDMADDILDELRFLKNVSVDDNNLTWKVTEAVKAVGNTYTYGGKRLNNISDEEVKQINDLVRERASAKKDKDYEIADEILETLEIKHGVRVDDTKQAWFFLSRVDDEMDDFSEKRGKRSVRNESKRDRNRSQMRSDWSLVKDDTVPEGISIDNNDVSIPEGVSIVDDGLHIPEGIIISEDTPAMPEGISIADDDDKSKVLQLESVETLSECTVPILKEKLKSAGLPVSGRKAELIDRLIQDQL